MNKYNNAKIYKIIDNTTEDFYIGSTIQDLKTRFKRHKYISPSFRNCSSKKIIEKNNFRIELIENYPCKNLEELRKREQYYIDKSKCINKHNAYLSKEDLKKYNKVWREKNKERLLKKYNERYKKNPELIKKQAIENYYKNHKNNKVRMLKHREYVKTWGDTVNNLHYIKNDVFI